MSDTPHHKPVRLAKLMARAGVASRRASETVIREGRVQVNGETVTDVATKVEPGKDIVVCDGSRLTRQDHVYYLLHKPTGYTCSAADDHADRLAIELLHLPDSQRVFSVGRLDRDSEGLLVFTNDGELANRLMHPRYEVDKCYQVTVQGTPTAKDMRRLVDGVRDKGEFLQARSARQLETRKSESVLEIVVAEGKKREIRRMCQAIACPVVRLLRVRLGPLCLGRFQPGLVRQLTASEVKSLKQATGLA